MTLLLSSCAWAQAGKPPAPADQPLAAKADVVVKDMAQPDPVSVKVGQTIGVVWPGGPAVWQVDFSSDELQLLTPVGKLANPGAAGWVWRATTAGEVEIVFTARVPCPNPPCDENPQRFTLMVRIK